MTTIKPSKKIISWIDKNRKRVKFDYYPHISNEIPWAMIGFVCRTNEKEIYINLQNENDNSTVLVSPRINHVKINNEIRWLFLENNKKHIIPSKHIKIDGITVDFIEDFDKNLFDKIYNYINKKFWIFACRGSNSKIDLPFWPDNSSFEAGLRLGRIKDNNLKALHLWNGWNNVKWLSLGESFLTDQSVEWICNQLKQLRWLGLGSNKISDKSIENISNLKKIEWLGLGETNITDNSVNFLQNLDKLKLLWLSGTKITSKSLQYITSLNQLQVLGLNRCNINSLESLKNINNLEVLFLDRTNISMSQLKKLKNKSQLRILSLAGNNFNDNDIEILKDFQGLYFIDLSSNPVSIKGIKKLLDSLKNLYAIKLKNINESDKIFEEIIHKSPDIAVFI